MGSNETAPAISTDDTSRLCVKRGLIIWVFD